MSKNTAGTISQEPKESQPPLLTKMSFKEKGDKNEINRSSKYHEENKKRTPQVNFDSNIVVRLKVSKPNKDSLPNRLSQFNTQENGQASPKGKIGNILQEGQKTYIAEPNNFPKFEKKQSAIPQVGTKSSAGNFPQKNAEKEKDTSLHETIEGTTYALTTRDTHQNDLIEEFHLKKNKSPTIRDLKAFYPKARAHFREKKEETTDESKFDKEAVENLDRWDNNYKQSLRTKDEELEQRRLRRNPKPGKTYEPQMNSKVINMIARDSREVEERERNTASPLLEKTNGPYKTTENIRQITNKKLLNMVVYNKAKTMAMKLDGDSLTEQTETMREDTISNFKNLQTNLGPLTTGTLIDYDALLEKLHSVRFPPSYLFDFSLEKKEKEDEELTLKFSLQEKDLLQKFQEMIIEIHSKKDIQAQMRINNHELVTKIKNFQAENENYEYDLINYEEKIRKTRQQNPSNVKNARRKAKEIVPSSRGLEEFRRLEKKKEETSEKIQENNKEIFRLQQELKRQNQRLEEIDEEIRDLKLFKSENRHELKILYLKMLKNERQLLLSYAEREDTLIYIIKQLWKINEEVSEDLFPQFLEKSFIKFLFKYAQLDYEREQIEHYKQSEEYKMFKKIQESKNEQVGKKKALNLIQTPFHIALLEVKERIDKLKKGLIKRKKPVFAQDRPISGTGSNFVKWEDMSENDQSTHAELTNDLLNFHSRVDLMLDEIKQEMATLREEEASKLFERYTSKAINEKVLRYLSKILILLFGKLEAEKFFMRFVHMKQQHEQKTAQNHSFKFESTRAFNALRVQTQSSFGLMMSHSTTFRKYRPEVDNLSTKSMRMTESKLLRGAKTNRPELPQWNVSIDPFETPEPNYRYNSLYNYFPELQNSGDASNYFVAPEKQSTNKSGFVSSRGATSQGDRGALSSRGTNLMLTQQIGTASTRGYSSQGNRTFSSQRLREFSSQGNRLVSPSSIESSSRVKTEGSQDKPIKIAKKVIINETPSNYFE